MVGYIVINVTECNMWPVLYIINYSTAISPQHQHYIHITIYVYNIPVTRSHMMGANENTIGAAYGSP